MSLPTYYSSRGGAFLGRQGGEIVAFSASLAPRRRLRAYSSSGGIMLSSAAPGLGVILSAATVTSITATTAIPRVTVTI